MKKMFMEHCEKSAEHCVTLAKAARAAADTCDDEGLKNYLAAAAEAHADQAEDFLNLRKLLAASDGLDKAVADGVHMVAPTGVRLVRRAGQPAEPVDLSQLDPELADLVKI